MGSFRDNKVIKESTLFFWLHGASWAQGRAVPCPPPPFCLSTPSMALVCDELFTPSFPP